MQAVTNRVKNELNGVESMVIRWEVLPLNITLLYHRSYEGRLVKSNVVHPRRLVTQATYLQAKRHQIRLTWQQPTSRARTTCAPTRQRARIGNRRGVSRFGTVVGRSKHLSRKAITTFRRLTYMTTRKSTQMTMLPQRGRAALMSGITRLGSSAEHVLLRRSVLFPSRKSLGRPRLDCMLTML